MLENKIFEDPDQGHLEAERILLERKYERLFNINAPSNRDKKYLKFVERVDEMKLDPFGIYSDRYKKASLIKEIYGYSKLIVGKNPITEKVLKHDIFDCKTERVGKAFENFYKKGLEIKEKFDPYFSLKTFINSEMR